MNAAIEAAIHWPAPQPPLVTILFAKHNSRTSSQALAVAQRAKQYREDAERRTILHRAAFERTAAQNSAS